MSINLQEPSISLSRPGDEEVLDEVVSYLNQNYAEPLDQGPIRLTGSAVYGTDPNDYDLVVQRQAEDRRDFEPGNEDRKMERPNAVDADEDDRVIAAMMRDLSDDIAFDTYNETNTMQRTQALLEQSLQVMPWGSTQPHNPVNRYELNIKNTDFDITFTPSEPNKDYVTLTEDNT